MAFIGRQKLGRSGNWENFDRLGLSQMRQISHVLELLTEVKSVWLGFILGWVTAQEIFALVFFFFFFFPSNKLKVFFKIPYPVESVMKRQ